MESIKVNRLHGSIGNIPYVTKLSTGHHEFLSDEPLDLGGEDKGPKAFEYLLGALVSCTCITIQMYAKRKQWNVDAINIDSELTRTTESGKQTTKAIMTIEFKSELTTEQIDRLMVIASKCPVHKTLIPAMEIEIKLKK